MDSIAMSVPRAVFHLPPARSAFPRAARSRAQRVPAPEARSRAGGALPPHARRRAQLLSPQRYQHVPRARRAHAWRERRRAAPGWAAPPVPIDPSSGAFGDPIALGRADLADRDARPCGPADDGWLLEVSWDRPPAIVDLGNARPPPARPYSTQSTSDSPSVRNLRSTSSISSSHQVSAWTPPSRGLSV